MKTYIVPIYFQRKDENIAILKIRLTGEYKADLKIKASVIAKQRIKEATNATKFVIGQFEEAKGIQLTKTYNTELYYFNHEKDKRY